jgi:hypothetical protein
MALESTARERSAKAAYCYVGHGPGWIREQLLTTTGLVCYMTTKILIYYFLVERAVCWSQTSKATESNSAQYIVGGSMQPRLKTKLWLFNCLFMLRECPQLAVVL